MKFIKGINRHQILLFPEFLDSAIDQDNEVRIIDLFVDSLEIDTFGFKIDFKEEGIPAYQFKQVSKLQFKK